MSINDGVIEDNVLKVCYKTYNSLFIKGKRLYNMWKLIKKAVKAYCKLYCSSYEFIRNPYADCAK